MEDKKKPSFNSPQSATAIYITICSILYIVDLVTSKSRYVDANGKSVHFGDIFNYFSMAGDNVLHKAEIWRLVTSLFVHVPTGYSPIFFALIMFIFYIFGKPVEQFLGKKKMVHLMLFSGLVGNVAVLFFSIGGHHFGNWFLPMGGCVDVSIAVTFGLVLGYQKFKLLLFFLIPVEMTGRTFAILIVVFHLLGAPNAAMQIVNAVAIVFTYLFYKSLQTGEGPLAFMHKEKTKKPKMNKNQKGFKVVDSTAKEVRPEDNIDQYIEDKVNPILEKIAVHGFESLTEEEKKILEKARDNL